MFCELCDNLDFRRLKVTEHSVVTICKWPLKHGHLMVLPKRHCTKLSELSPEEAKDFLDTVEFTKEKLKELYDEPPLVIQNSGKHSSEIHFHFHVLPSKGPMRRLFSEYEGIPYREDISREEYEEMKQYLTQTSGPW